MANSQQLDIEIAHYDTEIKRMQDEREVLVAKRVELVEAELADAVAKVIALGGTASAEKQQKKKAPTRAPVNGPKKYLDPETGADWSGQGGSPAWIKGKIKEHFLNPAWSAAKVVKTAKANVSSQSATVTPTLGAQETEPVLMPVPGMGVQAPIIQQDGPTSAELEHPASISLVDSSANSVAELHAVPTLTVAPIVATVSQHDSAPPTVNPVENPSAAQAA